MFDGLGVRTYSFLPFFFLLIPRKRSLLFTFFSSLFSVKSRHQPEDIKIYTGWGFYYLSYVIRGGSRGVLDWLAGLLC